MKVDIFNTDKKYNIIYADPPWRYADRKCNGACEFHYETMKLEDIKNLPVKEIADKDICISAFKLNFPEINSNHIIMSEDIDRHNMISTFGIHKGLYDFIKKQFPLHKIHHYSLSNIVKSIEHSKNSGSKEVWANVSNNSIFINLVENGKLLLTNSFNVKKPTDSLYYIGSVYEQFNLSTKNTELYFCGDNEHFSLLKKHISLSNNISDLCEL